MPKVPLARIAVARSGDESEASIFVELDVPQAVLDATPASRS